MVKTAVILTVYNRKEITLQGLRSLYSAIAALGEGYIFDIYMTDDGCTDGTGEAVRRDFPEVCIIQGDGNLYWSGGMRKAWQAAINSGIDYDFYLWFNDDAELYNDALVTMYSSEKEVGDKAVISGAFCDEKGKATYGGWNKIRNIITPNGTLQPLFLMNGNLTLIPMRVINSIGIIDTVFKHSLGDWDYGRRAQKAGFQTLLTPRYVGVTARHDEQDIRCFNAKYSLVQRWRYLHKAMHNAKFSAHSVFVYSVRHDGIVMAIIRIFRPYIYVLFPSIYSLRNDL